MPPAVTRSRTPPAVPFYTRARVALAVQARGPASVTPAVPFHTRARVAPAVLLGPDPATPAVRLSGGTAAGP